MPRPKISDNVVRIMVSTSAEMKRAIDEYRIEYRLKTESQAIRRLIKAGLKQLAAKAQQPITGNWPPG